MSATNRGAKRQINDFYSTPSSVIKAILPYTILNEFHGLTVLEPACGKGSIIKELRAFNKNACILGYDIDESMVNICRANEKYATIYHEDFLKTNDISASLIITNPPYSLAQEFAEKSIKCAKQVVLLLRLNFLASLKRKEFFEENTADVYVLSKRPSFVVSCKCTECDWHEMYESDAIIPKRCPKCHNKIKKTGTDATEYAWFIWGGKHYKKDRGLIYHL